MVEDESAERRAQTKALSDAVAKKKKEKDDLDKATGKKRRNGKKGLDQMEVLTNVYEVCVCVCVYVCVRECEGERVRERKRVCVHICTYIYTYICVYICM